MQTMSFAIKAFMFMISATPAAQAAQKYHSMWILSFAALESPSQKCSPYAVMAVLVAQPRAESTIRYLSFAQELVLMLQSLPSATKKKKKAEQHHRLHGQLMLWTTMM
jgi:hypothetical protein